QRLTVGLAAGMKGRIGIAVSPVRHDRVWAIVEAKDGGIFRSDDGGATWQRTNSDSSVRERAWYYSHIIADTRDADTVYVLTLEINKSIDGGRTFQIVRAAHADNHALWIAPDDADRMINGNYGGASITMNGGRTWSSQDNQPTGQFYHVITDNQFPYRIYGAQQDNTTVSIPSRTDGPGIDRTDWYPVGGGESGYIAPSPRDPNLVYAGSYYGLLTLYHHRNREVRDLPDGPGTPRRAACGGCEVPVSVDGAHGDLTARSGHALHRRERAVQVDGSGPELEGDQPGSHAQRQIQAGLQRRPPHR